jgi:hypothetical protein
MGGGSRRRPINTTRETQEFPFSFLADSLARGSSGAIEAQESQGQRSFVNSETLPTKIDPTAKQTLEEAGVKFGEVVPEDELFQFVDLPEGWKKVRTDHSMWSKLLDEKDRERAQIFYKAAFYDRSSQLHLSCRYGVRQDYTRRDEEGVAVALVTDCGQTIHTTEPIPLKDKDRPWEEGDQAASLGTAWLDEHYPDWENPGAYWD